MSKFIKRPIVIEAVQLTKDEVIHTLEGNMTGHAGDWLITGVKGEQYPCKPDIFEATYRPYPTDDDGNRVAASAAIEAALNLRQRAEQAEAALAERTARAERAEAERDALAIRLHETEYVLAAERDALVAAIRQERNDSTALAIVKGRDAGAELRALIKYQETKRETDKLLAALDAAKERDD